jgi:tetratricopeptide (TPR) repeat protein/transcriptional regulator with XRE-family HTH domain
MECDGPTVHRHHGFGGLLKRYRVAAGLSQEALAERARLSARAIRAYEQGQRRAPYRDTVGRLVQALGLSKEEAVALEATVSRWRGPAQLSRQSPLAPGDRATGRIDEVPPLVGRTREVTVLERHLAGEGPPLLLLAGEPGIGKSRLLVETRGCAQAFGRQVLQGGCQRRSGQVPYAPLLEALKTYIQYRPPADLRTELRDCAWLVRLLPELANGPIEPLPGWTLPPEQERRLMFEAVARFLANITQKTAGQTTVLLLDDLQWAGTDALDLLATLVRSTALPTLRVVGTYRDTEMPPGSPLAEALADLAHAGLARHHALRPLTPQEAGQLLDALLGGTAEEAKTLKDRVVQRAGGVPFYLVSYAQGVRPDALESIPEDVVPWDIAQGVRQRIAALPEAAQEMLGAAAVIGRVVANVLLAHVVLCPEQDLLAAVEAACRARLLEQEGLDAYRFAHDVIREVIEADLVMARRLVLHRRIAEALEEQPGTPAVELLAYHYGRAGKQEEAVRYLERAGDHAWAQHANAAAEGHYRELVEWLDRMNRALDGARAREKLGTLLTTTGRQDPALSVLEQAAVTYQTTDDLESLGRITALIGRAHEDRGTPAQGLERLQRLAERLEARGLSRALVHVYYALSDVLWACGRYREGMATGDRSVEVARRIGDTRSLAMALGPQSLAYLALGRLAEAWSAADEAVTLAEAAGDLQSLPQPLYLMSVVLLRRGDLERSMQYCERELVVVERKGESVRMVAATAQRGLIAYVRGDWPQARKDGEQALALSRRIGTSWASPMPLTVLGLVSYGEGRLEEARGMLEECVTLAARVGQPPGEHFAPGILAECDVLEGRPAQACARLAPLLDALALAEADLSLLLTPYAWARLGLGEPAGAAEMVGQAITLARARNDQLNLVDALRVQALVRVRQRDWERAAPALAEGLALARDLPYPFAEARLLYVNGEVCLHAGQPGPAREQLEAALTIFRRLGARKDIEQSEQLLAMHLH